MLLVLLIFGHKQTYYTNCNFDLMMVRDEGQVITKVLKIHPEGNRNACTRVNGYPSKSC